MGDINQPDLVMPICAIMSRHDDAIQWAVQRYEDRGFRTIVQSEPYSFSMTAYYQREMGSGLLKQIVGFGPLQDPAELCDWKRESNAWELEYAKEFRKPEERPLNLDPGYLSLAKFVLATTKDRDHRIYLQRGIFAEVTMTYSQKAWRDHPWTYPDYQLEPAQQFLADAREQLKKMRRAPE